jgi:hypothetical protein
VNRITETEFKRLVGGILDDAESIIRYNPIGSREEILLWMLLSSLVVYLSLNEIETPCFPGKPDAATYRQAIEFVLKDRKADEFDITSQLDKLSDT